MGSSLQRVLDLETHRNSGETDRDAEAEMAREHVIQDKTFELEVKEQTDVEI